MSADTMAGATVAITGGTGSFGSTMAGHLLRNGVDKIHILSRDETKQDEMHKRFSDSRLRFFLGDVRDFDSVAGAFVGTDYVFHAAALKQVPSCEFFPEQAVKTNVVGSSNVIEAAAKAGVQSVVCLSTDKAVYPVNAMGLTKLLGFPAITLRESIERPEALDTGGIVMTGLDLNDVEEGAALVMADRAAGKGVERPPPTAYLIADTSTRVVRFIMSTARRHAVWSGLHR